VYGPGVEVYMCMVEMCVRVCGPGVEVSLCSRC